MTLPQKGAYRDRTMAISLSYDKTRDLTIFTIRGNLTFDQQIKVLKKFYHEGPSANMLIDFRKMEGNRISSAEIKKIIFFAKKNEDRRAHGKTALVSNRDLDYGLSRMSATYGEVKKLPWKIQAFRSMDAALKWIG
jgi:hypothetical protein